MVNDRAAWDGWNRWSELHEFLQEFHDGVINEAPLCKLNRWLGYIQAVLIERGVTTVKAERDWTRPLFRPLDFPKNEIAQLNRDSFSYMIVTGVHGYTTANIYKNGKLLKQKNHLGTPLAGEMWAQKTIQEMQNVLG
jgi:hypothetical protein